MQIILRFQLPKNSLRLQVFQSKSSPPAVIIQHRHYIVKQKIFNPYR